VEHIKASAIDVSGMSKEQVKEIEDTDVQVTLKLAQWSDIILAAVHGADTLEVTSFPKKIEILNAVVVIAKAVDPVVREVMGRHAACKVLEGLTSDDKTH